MKDAREAAAKAQEDLEKAQKEHKAATDQK